MLTVGDRFPEFALKAVLPGPSAELGEVRLEHRQLEDTLAALVADEILQELPSAAR